MADFANLGFEWGDEAGGIDHWTRTTSAGALTAAGYKVGENLLTRSEEFNHGDWTAQNCSVTENQDGGPFDNIEDVADKLVENSAASAYHQLWRNLTPTASRVTLSVYAKALGRDWLRLVVGSLSAGANFNLATGAMSTFGTLSPANPRLAMEDAGDGYYRCSLTLDITPGSTNVYISANDSGTGDGQYTGDGRDALLLFGAQFEQDGEAPGPYAKTVAATRTVEQGFDSFETRWDGVEVYLSTLAEAGATAAEYDVGLANPVTYESFEGGAPAAPNSPWDVEDYLFSLSGQATAGTYFRGENLLAWSEAFDEAGSWGVLNGSIDADSAAVPTGFTGQSDRLIENNSAGLHAISQVATTTATRVVLSVYAKKELRDWIYLYVTGSGDFGAAWFDLDNGVVGNDMASGATVEGYSMEDAGNGFYRCTLDVSGIAAGSVTASIRSAIGDLSQTHTGNNQLAFAAIGAMLVNYGSPLEYFKTESTPGVETVAVEDFEVQWDSNSDYAFDWDDLVPPPSAAAYDTTPEAHEDFEEDWDDNDNYLADWTDVLGGPGATTAQYDSTPEPYEDFEEDWPTVVMTTV